ncbi:MAG: ribosome small subunit-dependent GTPase A [Chlorobi bacterium]|nr:ribosome small subunit-dependent GTPase A [Chlorobiota bacterium]MCI0715757.1 ribosome small subunit-dependent GTPase A [Chlorobiota bacterium]
MKNLKDLRLYGWNEFFEAYFNEYASDGLAPARVAVEHRNNYELYSEYGELIAEKSGKLFYNATSADELPAVGDWVVAMPIQKEKKAVISAVLPRRTKFSRKKAGPVTEEQVVAANVDTAFIVSSLNQELNFRRMERYLALAWDNDVKPVIVLSKADLCDDVYAKLVETQNNITGTDIHVVSALKNAGIDELFKYFESNKTIAVIGSSGVGKSTLINSLLHWKKMKVSDISLYKDKGRHTTTHRELTLVPGGGLIIDTPGMREIQLWEGGGGLSELFEDIEQLSLECKFSDCRHESEPGCAVKEAIKSGTLDPKRFKSYRKLQNEINYFERKQNVRAQLEEKKKWKKITNEARKKRKEKF